nr:MAG TPA: hypothetical protein [Caudoviricetes sp.]DAM34446.1 MAG TPA: hypothetical protein [Caudoviricetes sp.]
MIQTEHRGFCASPAWYALQVGVRETKFRKLCACADRNL